MLLPMSTEIEFTTDSNSEFGDFLVKTNIWDNLLSEVISSVDGQGGEYDAVVLVKHGVTALNGKGGGGRPDMAQAGGSNVENLSGAIERIKEFVAQMKQ